VEQLRGRVGLRSEPGQGTSVLLRIPLTLAIIEAMLVRVGGALFAIPLTAILECFQAAAADVTETMDGQEHVAFRGELSPVLRLADFTPGARETPLAAGVLVAVEHDEQATCLLVDELLGQNQIVVKPMPRCLGRARRVSGCSILGDGSVCLILDIERLVEHAAGSQAPARGREIALAPG
jgi:two-component system chemotaxis sensor kinase CheA